MLSIINQLQHSRLLPWLRHQSWLVKDVIHQRNAPVFGRLPVSTQQMQTINFGDDDSDELTLTKQETISYLENVLLIKDPFRFAQKRKFECLCEVQRRTKFIQPFSTVSYIQNEMCCPTKEEIKETMFMKQGGGCLQINLFTKAVLKQLGYQAYIACASLPKNRAVVYESHTGLVVKDVTKKGSMHLVEPGTRHPILDPVSLDFKRASPEYQLIGHPIKFFRDSPSIVKLCMPISKMTDAKRNSNVYYTDGQMWRVVITYRTLETQNWEYCSRIADMIIKSAKLMPNVHKEIIICGYCNGLWTIIKGKSFLQYDKNDNEIIKQFNTDDEVVENAHICFPQYSKEMLQNNIAYAEGANKLMQC